MTAKFPHSAGASLMIGATFFLTSAFGQATPAPPKVAPYQSYSEILAAAPLSAWRVPDPQNVIYLEIATGRVVIELAPHVAPSHVANIRTLIRENYFDGLAIVRSQDNYVVQWGEPVDTVPPKALKTAKKNLPPEFERLLSPAEFASFAFDRLPDVDGYAPQVGVASGFPAGRDPNRQAVWLAHCYGTIGVGRGGEATSGSGASLYAVTGHAPRHLDRNITVVGRVLQGMPLLSVMPRGTKALGFYEKASEYAPIKSIRIAADVPVGDRTNLDVIRTDTPTFARAVEALRNRGGDWFKVPAGHVELCNVPIAVRASAPVADKSATK